MESTCCLRILHEIAKLGKVYERTPSHQVEQNNESSLMVLTESERPHIVLDKE